VADRVLAWKPPRRHEVRVAPCADGWDVRPGPNGETYRFPSEDAALHCAHELARRAWADDERLSCVLRFIDDTWSVDAVFGVLVPPLRMPRPWVACQG
jgi:hypothetical protein